MTRLHDPLRIRSMTLSNRLVVPPMRCGKAADNGIVTDALIEHYLRLADGPGLVIVEHAYILDGGKSLAQLGISHDAHIPGLAKLARAIHSCGAATVLQINHVGSMASPTVIGSQPRGPSAIIHPRNREQERAAAMTEAEIQEVVHAFAQAATRAINAGFDGVEVHCSHGYLNSQFMSPITNHRHDQYGGSPENRVRIAAESVHAIRRVIGDEYPLFCRFGARDYMPGGLELSESIIMAQILVNAGVDVLDVSGGLCGIEPPGDKGQGFFIPEAEAVKQATGAITIGVGGITDPHVADNVIQNKRVDLVAIGRAMLQDGSWCRKALQATSV